MALINRWLSEARDGLKKQSTTLAKPFGLDLLTKVQTEDYLRPYQLASSPVHHVTLPKVADVTERSKLIFTQTEVATGHTHVWRLDNLHSDATQLRSGGLKLGRKVLDTDFGTNALFKDLLNLKQRPDYETPTLIAPWSHYWGRYYDYLFFVAAKLCRIKDTLPASVFAEATVAYPLLHTTFERELLAILGIRQEKLIDSRTHTVRFSTAILGDNNSWFYPNPADVLSLRRYVCSVIPEPTGPGRRIYIRRSGRRRVLNEDALVALLTTYGFDIIEDQPRSIAEQVALYAGASFIIGPHGASFANVLWCRPGTHLLELFADNYVPEYFRYLAELLGLRYSAYCAGLVGGSQHSHVDDDIVVSIDQFERGLNDLFRYEVA